MMNEYQIILLIAVVLITALILGWKLAELVHVKKCPDCGEPKRLNQESGIANTHIHKHCQDRRLQLMIRNAKTLPEKKGVTLVCRMLAEAALLT